MGDPVARVVWDHQHIQMLESMPLDENAAPHRDEAVAMMRERFRERVGTLHGACLAAKRPEDAERVAAEGTKLDDTAEMRLALVEAALDLNVAAPLHLRLLDEATLRGGDDGRVRSLRDRVLAKVKNRG